MGKLQAVPQVFSKKRPESENIVNKFFGKSQRYSRIDSNPNKISVYRLRIMKSKRLFADQNRNLFNLCLIFAILIIITACVCRTDRENGFETNRSNPAGNADNSGNTEVSTNTSQTDSNKKEDRGDFVVEHLGVKNPRYEQIDRKIKEDKTLEKAADKLNRALILPNDIYLRTQDCGEANAFYNPNDKSITFCYELMEHFYRLFKSVGDTDEQATDSMFDATNFVFLHEMGHALIDNYKLPVMANEEDAADKCSSYICLEEMGDDGVRAVLAAADAFKIESQMSKPSNRDMADEHLLQEQRYFVALCMVYGSNPDKYRNIKDKGYLPEARAVRCPSEYERTAKSWGELLAPWRKS